MEKDHVEGNDAEGKFEDWERLISRVAANGQELPHLEVPRARLEAMLKDARDASAEQAAHTAGKQEASAKLKTLQTEGERLANLMRAAVKQHYGIRSEKLSEFGLTPFRGRKRKTSEPETPAATPPPSASHPGGSSGSAQ